MTSAVAGTALRASGGLPRSAPMVAGYEKTRLALLRDTTVPTPAMQTEK
jgi:hypothetical protein